MLFTVQTITLVANVPQLINEDTNAQWIEVYFLATATGSVSMGQTTNQLTRPLKQNGTNYETDVRIPILSPGQLYVSSTVAATVTVIQGAGFDPMNFAMNGL